jgi:hypothetical protein
MIARAMRITLHAEHTEHAKKCVLRVLRFLRATAALAGALALASPAAAQTPNFPEVSAGYAALNDPKTETVFRTGWLIGGAVPLTTWLSAAGDVSMNHATVRGFGSDTDLAIHAFMGGVRASASLARLVEFAQVMVGVSRESGSRFGVTETNNTKTLQTGVGLDFPIRDRVSARGQIDVRFFRARPGGNEPGYHARFGAGVVYRFRG